MRSLNEERRGEDLLLKFGILEGPCLAVTLNDRQDYFGQTVNIASRVQNLAVSQSIFATGRVVEDGDASRLLEASGLTPKPHRALLRGIANEMNVYEIP
jgi:class 3 adenylate cyclase